MHDAATHHGQQAGDVGDLLLIDAEEVRRQQDEVGELACLQRALHRFVAGEPCTALRPQAQGLLAFQQVFIAVQGQATDRAPGHQPRQRHPGVVAGHAGGVGTGADRYALGQHPLHRWRVPRRLHAIALHECLALVGHAVLHGDAAIQCTDTLDVARGDGLGVVDEPVQAIERHLAVDLFVDVEDAADAFVVGRVNAERPALFHQQLDHVVQFRFQLRRQLRARLVEQFEIRCREHQHLTGTVVAQQVIALARLQHLAPAAEIADLAALVLGEQVVGDAHGQLIIAMQLLDDLVVLGVVLEATAGVDHRGDAQAVQLAHEMAGGIGLVFDRQLRPLGQGRIQDQCIRLGQQQAGGIAQRIAHDLPAGRIRSFLGIAAGTQRSAVEQRAVIQVQQEHRRIRGDVIQFLQGRQALLGELGGGESTDHAYPLRRRGTVHLRLQHGHRIGQ
ncbi:hypothetical protein D3C73_884940 [compost metagenome]